jgi:predicted dehydrogenase
MANVTVNWGIVGPGGIANRFADAITVVDGASLQAVASRDQDRAGAFAQMWNAEAAYGSYEQIVNDERVDAVYIATPHRFHHENTRMCLEAGKHVLCEKPITVNAREAESLFSLARDRGLFLMEGMWTVFLPAYQQVREWLDDGAIGNVHLMTSTFGFVVPRNPTGRMLNPALAGGAILDMGVYNTAISRWVVGRRPDSVVARAIIGETGVDELTSVSLHFGAETVSQFTTTMLCKTLNDFTIYGSDGHIRIHPNFCEAGAVTLSRGDHTTDVQRPVRHNGFEYQIEEAMQCIDRGLTESPVMPPVATMDTMKTMDQIRAKIGLSYSFEEHQASSVNQSP